MSYFKSSATVGLYQMTFHIPSDCCSKHLLHSSEDLVTAARLRSSFVQESLFNQATTLVSIFFDTWKTLLLVVSLTCFYLISVL